MAPTKVPMKRESRAWENLTPALADWILDAMTSMGFAQMTPVQAATLPHFLGNKDVVVEASSPCSNGVPILLTSEHLGCHR